jgi:hypothetical protein
VSDAVWHALVVFAVAGLIVEALVLVGILRQLGTLVLQLGPPRHGEVEEGPEAGTVVDIDTLSPGVPAIVLFLAPGCEVCKPIAAALPVMRRTYAGLRLLPVVVGDDERAKGAYAAGLNGDARTDLDGLFRDWNVPGTPFAVGVGEDGRVRTSGIVNNLPQLETLAEVVLQPPPPVPASADLLGLDADDRTRSLDGDPAKGV